MVARMRVAAFIGALAVGLSPGCQGPTGSQERTAQQNGAGEDVLVETPPIAASTYLAAARLHESQGRLPEAIQQYQYALKESPANVDLLCRLGALCDRTGNGSAAEKYYIQAVKLAPADARVHNNLAFSYILRNKWKDAEIELTRSIELSPQFVRARINLGMVLAHMSRFDDAFRQFETVLPAGDAWYNLGLMYQSKRKTVEAATAFKRALEADPKLTSAKEQLSRMSSATLSAADQMLDEQRKSEALAKAAVAAQETMATPQTAPAEDAAGEAEISGLTDLEMALDATPVLEVPSTQPTCVPDEAVELPETDELDPAERAEVSGPCWWEQLDAVAGDFTTLAMGDAPADRLAIDPTTTSVDPERECEPLLSGTLLDRSALMAAFDAMFPPWQRSAERITGFGEASPWLTSVEYSRFDWQYSPAAFVESDFAYSALAAAPSASTQPE